MTQILHLQRPVHHGWLDLAHVLAGAPMRRRREFALTRPDVFRSECFVEDLPEPAVTRPHAPPMFAGARLAALLCAVPVAAALLGAAVVWFDRVA